MDVRIEAAPIAADAQMNAPVVLVMFSETNMVTRNLCQVASIPCPTLGSHSLSAVAPDLNFERRLAKAA